jgi:hypothetical protein
MEVLCTSLQKKVPISAYRHTYRLPHCVPFIIIIIIIIAIIIIIIAIIINCNSVVTQWQ